MLPPGKPTLAHGPARAGADAVIHFDEAPVISSLLDGLHGALTVHRSGSRSVVSAAARRVGSSVGTCVR